MFVTQGVWCAADQTEESIATRFDVGAVLDVGVRPESGRRLIIALVEQGVERLQHQSFVSLGCRLRHSDLHSGGSDKAPSVGAPGAGGPSPLGPDGARPARAVSKARHLAEGKRHLAAPA